MSARNNEYIIDEIDKAISELVIEKWKLQKAYNYYNGKRDPEQFRYLEENFGLGSPTAVEFTPLLKKHVDALVGEYLGTPILPKVSCKDSETISNITREKQLQITEGIIKFLKDHLHNSILQFIDGKDENKLIEKLNENCTLATKYDNGNKYDLIIYGCKLRNN